MSLITINWNPGKKELRRFGLTMLTGFTIIAGLLLWQEHARAALVVFSLGIGFGVVGGMARKDALWLYRSWMAVAFVMGNIISRIVLTVFFFVVLTPVSLLFKITGRDRLNLKHKGRASCWADLDQGDKKYISEHQY
ncbi:MAG: hypothetical protein HQM16_14020 [Deltaproteobacteria bacterium]|nr:hypothetical protein [Deltaproteobacteria bacterium]